MGRHITDEDLRLNIIVNGDPAKHIFYEASAAAGALANKVKRSQAALDEMRKTLNETSPELIEATQKHEALKKKMIDARDKVIELQRQFKLETMTLSELQKHLSLLKVKYKEAIPDSKEWKAFQKELLKTSCD